MTHENICCIYVPLPVMYKPTLAYSIRTSALFTNERPVERPDI